MQVAIASGTCFCDSAIGARDARAGATGSVKRGVSCGGGVEMDSASVGEYGSANEAAERTRDPAARHSHGDL
jgi:hypothetical protein